MNTTKRVILSIFDYAWPVLFLLALLILIGCSQGEIEDAGKAVNDTVVEHGPKVVEEISQGDWVGAAVAGVIAIASGVGGYVAYRRKRKKKK